MKIYQSLDTFTGAKNPVVTIGTFDGVHIGHRKIISRLKETAVREKGETVLLTFHPHPRIVLFPEDNSLRLLNTQEEKTQLLEKEGIDHLIIIPFTKEFSRLTSIEFARDILANKVKAKKLVIGYDHHFGRNREGSLEHLREYGTLYNFEVEEIPAQDINQVTVSSTKIRKALYNGDAETAAVYLGYPYSLTGTVIKGNHVGRKINFPTANLQVSDPYKLIPANGVYGVKVKIEKQLYKGMMNIGYRPTVGGKTLTIEVHIFSFDSTIYDQQITVSLLKRIRDELKFESLNALREQLEKDKKTCLNLFLNYNEQ